MNREGREVVVLHAGFSTVILRRLGRFSAAGEQIRFWTGRRRVAAAAWASRVGILLHSRHLLLSLYFQHALETCCP